MRFRSAASGKLGNSVPQEAIHSFRPNAVSLGWGGQQQLLGKEGEGRIKMRSYFVRGKESRPSPLYFIIFSLWSLQEQWPVHALPA